MCVSERDRERKKKERLYFTSLYCYYYWVLGIELCCFFGLSLDSLMREREREHFIGFFEDSYKCPVSSTIYFYFLFYISFLCLGSIFMWYIFKLYTILKM